MPKQRRAAPSDIAQAVANGKKGAESAEMEDEEAYRKRFEPVAPWKRDNIPDYGPVSDKIHLGTFVVIGMLTTLFYEYTNYFDQISRWIAYLAIWFPLWFRLLTDVSPQLSEEGVDAQERLQFKAELERIQKEAEQIDD